jgi:hypothetical protein
MEALMSLDELIEIIQKSKFQDLLDMHQFKLVYKKYEKRGGIQDSYSLGFESNRCKLGFHCEATIGVAMIAKSSDWDKAEWIDLESVIAYLLKQPLNQTDAAIKQLAKYTPYREKLAYVLSHTAASFEPLFDRIVAMFENEDKIDEWRPALENYIEEDTRRRYGSE